MDQYAPGADYQVHYIADMYKEVRALAVSKGYDVHKMPWLRSVKAYTQQLDRSRKNIENGGWKMEKRREGGTGRAIMVVTKVKK